MSDTRTLLKYFDSSDNLIDWNNPDCALDGYLDNNWQGHQDSSTAYHTVKGSGYC